MRNVIVAMLAASIAIGLASPGLAQPAAPGQDLQQLAKK